MPPPDISGVDKQEWQDSRTQEVRFTSPSQRPVVLEPVKSPESKPQNANLANENSNNISRSNSRFATVEEVSDEEYVTTEDDDSAKVEETGPGNQTETSEG